MTVYLANIILTLIVAKAAENAIFFKKIHKKRNGEISTFCILLILSIWTFIYAYRGIEVGTDTSGYIGFYQLLKQSTQSYVEYLEIAAEPLFESIKYFCCKVLNMNWVFFAFTIAVLTYFPVIYTVKKEGKRNFCFSLLLYIFLMFYYSGFNAMRQAVAVSITFLSYYSFFKKKKYVKYFFCMFIAFNFHSTAVIAIPFHLISKLELKSKRLWAIIGVLVLSVFAFPVVWNYATSLLLVVGKDYVDNSFSGSGYLRVVVCAVPVVIGLWKYRILKQVDEEIDQQIILLILATFLLVFSTNNWLFARVADYCYIFAILYIPKLQYIFTENSRRLGKVLIGGLYFLYMIALMLHGDANLYPYTFL